ncbi:MAG TPA: error-prone DNA polymerase [Tepidisphaeraceae bacterium]|nr:error-prone DNA polymerase [Tepidisphaeraceae bacterium]
MPEFAVPKLRHPPPPPAASALEALDAGQYAELDVVSNFSFLRGASHPDELVYRATVLGYKAIAITDLNSLAGIVRAFDATKQVIEQGGRPPKLIIGARLTFTDNTPDLLVHVTDRPAYARLCRLLTIGKRRTEKGQCSLTLQDFLDHNEGLLAAISPTASEIPEKALHLLREALGSTDRLSLATNCLHGPDDVARLEELSQISRRHRIPLLATNNAHYHIPERRPLQDILTCIRHICTIQEAGHRLFPNAERYLKSPGQMRRLFVAYPNAIQRGLELAERCTFSLEELRYEYPHELVPAGKTALEHLTDLTWRGAAKRYPEGIPQKVVNQIDHELKLIAELKFEPYFLTVQDLVRFARSRGILCQGRGSAANSAVCYCIGVTSVDPARIDVLFERFVSAARGEPPDIDIDFEHERREEVIQYIYEKYGRERAGMTAEVITYRGRSAVRDVGKALGLSLDLVDQMAKRLDWWHLGSLSDGMLNELNLNPADPTIRRVIDLTTQLLGFPRHLGQHVGGMVMTHTPLCELVPIENASMPNRTVIEWDKDDIDTLGILKVDALALGMLTCISRAFRLINERNKDSPPLELHTIPSEDPVVYDMISDADTIGVFQVESRAQMTMLPRLRPRSFYDLVIEVAIVRPGPIQGNMVHPYLRRRNGEEPVTYPGEAIRGVLEKTLGVPLFQEQAMKLTMVGAGFSAGDADRLRRAMATWRKGGLIDEFHDKIISGMLANGYTREFAEQCFNQIRGFGLYGFPESHAASFALLVYISSWLKRYYPAAFCAALLNSQPMGFYAPAQIVQDAQQHGVTILPCDINLSHWDCLLSRGEACLALSNSTTDSDKSTWGRGGPSVRLGFRQIKGLRIAHAQRIIECRNKYGPFKSIEHFQQLTRLPRHAMHRLAEADSFSSLNLTRRQALWQVLALDDRNSPLFDDLPAPDSVDPNLPTMPLGQEVMTDYSTIGLSLKEHPVALVRAQLNQKQIIPAAQVINMPYGRWVRVAGLVLIRQRPGTASGIVFETLEDETGIVNLIVRPNIYAKYRLAARHSALLQAEGYVERQGQVVHVMAWRLHDLSHLLAGYRFTSRDFH